MAKVIEFATISENDDFKKRCVSVCETFEYQSETFTTIDDLAEKMDDLPQITLACVDGLKFPSASEAAGSLQVVSQMLPDSYIVLVMSGKISAKDIEFIKKSGADAVLSETEFMHTSKFEFISSQKIRASYLPIKAWEVVQGSETEFKIFHIMPLNGKFLPVVFPGNEIDERKFKKLNDVSELYIAREDAQKYREYVNTFHNDDENGIVSKARAQFLEFCVSFTDLVLLILDQSEGASFDRGKELYGKTESLAETLIETLSKTPNPWSVVNNSSVGDFGSVERSPAIAAYSGLLAAGSKIGNVKEVMIGALLADIGMLELSPAVTRKLATGEPEDLHPEELQEYMNHPTTSLNACLSKKLQIPENVKNMILMSHETVDKKGFPKKVPPERIPDEAMIIQFCQYCDRKSTIRMGEQRKEFAQVAKQTAHDELENSRFKGPVLLKIMPLLKK
jgi:response regulator RpfG family c-di-GMP phosphodiesterase